MWNPLSANYGSVASKSLTSDWITEMSAEISQVKMQHMNAIGIVDGANIKTPKSPA